MQINVRTHHVDITPALKEYSEKKMHKLEKYFESIQEILVELDIVNTADENKRQVAMATIWAAQTIIRAKETSKDMYASIDMIFEKLEKQIKKHKDKLKSRKDGAGKRTIIAIPAKERSTSKSPIIDILEDEKHYNPKPMTPEEAAELLDLESLNFLVFRNSTTETIQVIYLMHNGDYGLIET